MDVSLTLRAGGEISMMRKIYANILMILCSLAVYSQNIEGNYKVKEPYWAKNSALFIRPIDIFNQYKSGYYGLSFEGETAFSHFISAKSISLIAFGYDGFMSSLNIGIQINPFGKALEGLMVSICPGIMVDSLKNNITYHPSVLCEGIANIIISGKLIFGLYYSVDMMNKDNMVLGIKIGYCYENKKYKVRVEEN
jgi:hypothetical protein